MIVRFRDILIIALNMEQPIPEADGRDRDPRCGGEGECRGERVPHVRRLTAVRATPAADVLVIDLLYSGR